MKTRFLFPYSFKFIGLVLFVLHIPFIFWKGNLNLQGTGLFSGSHLFFIVTVVTMVTGLLFMAFSKERVEDEQIAQLRLDSLQWAVYFTYGLLVISLIFTFGPATKDLMRTTLWAPLMFFIARFRWKMYLLNREARNAN